ncbi:MAG: SUMF1/EgtB/PvdO family nonheme iron enzyme [Saprospirales bacterium]|nr:SUMF1/EgtB/PvdO family nonheme iron enzyme [Saprospirales bacterium]MBK8920325.1 SUMF1/EgtB/PvdO family nonheme iron enzyme [Saprospirales bacterium]
MKTILLTLSCTLILQHLTAQDHPFIKSIVRITAQIEGVGEETGAGIIVGKEGGRYFLVTAQHVVAESDDISLLVHGVKSKYKATLVHADDSLDAAVLAFTPEKPLEISQLIPAEETIIAQGKKVQSIGHPGGGYWIPNLINIVQQTSLYEDERFFSITPQAVVGGCSGGPVFLENGAWLGMITETGMVQAKCLKADALTRWLQKQAAHHGFIYTPAPEMVAFKAGISRVDSFFIHLLTDSWSGEPLDYSTLGLTEVGAFSIGKYETTVLEFEAFVIASGYVTTAERTGYSNAIRKDPDESRYLQRMRNVNWRHDEFGRLRPRSAYDRPVIHVSWEDADAYCRWVSQRTGKNYRLPGGNEWIYAFLPAKNKPSRPTAVFGNIMDSTWNTQIGINMMPNLLFTKYADGHTLLAPAGAFSPNAWGVHDLYGNVSEWVSDGIEDWNEEEGDFVRHLFLGPNWLVWYRNDKQLFVQGGYPYCFLEGESSGQEYAFEPALRAKEANCFLGFRVAGD